MVLLLSPLFLLLPPLPEGPAHHHGSNIGTNPSQAFGWVPLLDQSSGAKAGRATWFKTVPLRRGGEQDGHVESQKSFGPLSPGALVYPSRPTRPHLTPGNCVPVNRGKDTFPKSKSQKKYL